MRRRFERYLPRGEGIQLIFAGDGDNSAVLRVSPVHAAGRVAVCGIAGAQCAAASL